MGIPIHKFLYLNKEVIQDKFQCKDISLQLLNFMQNKDSKLISIPNYFQYEKDSNTIKFLGIQPHIMGLFHHYGLYMGL